MWRSWSTKTWSTAFLARLHWHWYYVISTWCWEKDCIQGLWVTSELTYTLIKLQNKPPELTLEPLLMAALEGMAVQINSPKCPSEDVNEVCKLLFITSLKPLESIPPTNHALYQHVKRSLLAAHHWIQALQKRPIILPPKSWGWVWNKRLEDLDAPLEWSYRSY